ncbi:ABC transporter permease [Microtetraspora sp. NBRC 16547]|uniref:branched-chain amino acid ABC transporter permease n=1 Tax=Microtetraspora sp. NBRC 16547 TaxID=3030993 RepID=UPI002556984C|nr:ABC transporter permease [Microtetraspora sp. NBRC 16547]
MGAVVGVLAPAWAGTPITTENVLRVVLFALPIAGIYAISATGLVVIHSTTGIFNLAQGAIGMMCAFLFWELSVNQEMPRSLALILVLFVIAPAMGLILDRFLMRRLARAPLATQLIGTVGLMAALLGIATWIWDPNRSYPIAPFGGDGGVRIAGVLLTWHRIITIGVAIVVAIALRHLMLHTRLGVTMRAVVDDPDLAAMHGVKPGRVSSISWIIGCMCAALAGILIAPEIGNMSAETLSLLIIDSFAAAVIGRLRNLPMTYVGALMVGLVVTFSTTFLDLGQRWSKLPTVLPALLLFVALLLLPQQKINLGRVVRTFKMENQPSWRSALVAAFVLVGAAAVAAPLLSDVNASRLTSGIVVGVILLGLVPLLGWAGIPFFAPYALAGVGAWATWRFQEYMPGVLALVVAGAITGIVGIIASLPALRLRGLYMALSSIAFALVMTNLVFLQPEIFGQYRQLDRPSIVGLELDSPQAFALFTTVIYAVIALALTWLRTSRFGRQVVAMRDSEAAASCLGISLLETKAAVFAVAGIASGIGGGLLALSQRFASQEQFPMVAGLALILTLAIWGVGMTSAPIIAGLTMAALVIITHDWAEGGWTNALELAGPGLAALALVSAPRGQIVQIVEHAKYHPLATVLRVGALFAGGFIGVRFNLPGAVGFLLAILLYLVADVLGSLISERRRRATAGGVHGDPAASGADGAAVGITDPLTKITARALDRRLGVSNLEKVLR